VTPLSVSAGELVQNQRGVVLSSAPGDVDVALLGVRELGLAGDGALASVSFRVLSSGDPKIAIAQIDARNSENQRLDSNVLGAPQTIPGVTEFKAPAPNPFRDRAALQFNLARRGPVELAIFSVDGRRVRTLLNETRDAGSYRLVWDGTDERGHAAKAGMFFARLSVGPERFSRTLIRIR
jgi:hypothetical protein